MVTHASSVSVDHSPAGQLGQNYTFQKKISNYPTNNINPRSPLFFQQKYIK